MPAFPTVPGRHRVAAALAWLACALTLYVQLGAFPLVLRDLTVARDGDQPHPAVLPWKAGRDGAFVLTGTVISRPWSRPVLRLVPDAAMFQIFVNGRQVNPPIGRPAPHDAEAGVDLNLHGLLASGTNAIEIHATNVYGQFGGLRVLASPAPLDAWMLAFAASFALAAALAVRNLLLALEMDRVPRWIVYASLLVQLLYFSATGPLERSSDVESHLIYIDHVRTQRSLPAREDCFECHQPPLYFVAAAAVEEGARLLGFADPLRAVQLLSIACATTFLIYAARTLALFLPPSLPLWTMTALIAFFPSQFLHAPRIGNDSLLYAVAAMLFFHLCRWWRSSRRRTGGDYRSALALGSLALCVKATALVPIALHGFLHLYSLFSDAVTRGRGCGARGADDAASWWAREARRAAVAVAVVALAFVMAFARTLSDRIGGGDAGFGLAASMSIDEGQRVGVGVDHFFAFDVADYFTAPYPHPYLDSSGRQQFVPYLLKTALFGDFGIHGGFALALARALQALLLVLLFWSGFALLRAFGPANFDALLPASAGMTVWFVALTVFHLSSPYACTMYWRLIVPVLVPIAVLMGRSWEDLRSSPRQRKAADMLLGGAVAAFCLLSVVYWSIPAATLYSR